MSLANAHDIEKEKRIYITVFVTLAFLTIVTVMVSKLHFGVVGNIVVALIIATIKASLVASYFMHLISEKKLIYSVLTLTFFFFAFMVFMILAGHYDKFYGLQIVS